MWNKHITWQSIKVNSQPEMNNKTADKRSELHYHWQFFIVQGRLGFCRLAALLASPH